MGPNMVFRRRPDAIGLFESSVRINVGPTKVRQKRINQVPDVSILRED